MSSESVAPPGEFRQYRRFLVWFILTTVPIGCLYLLVSVAVTIYQRQHTVPTGTPVTAIASPEQLDSCYEELSDVTQGLERHLHNFHHLFAHYDAGEAQRWADNRSFWLGQWKAAGEHCPFGASRESKQRKDWEQLAVVHAELRAIEASYTKELLRFGQEQAPALERVRQRLKKIGKHLVASQDSQPVLDVRESNTTPTDSGESHHE